MSEEAPPPPLPREADVVVPVLGDRGEMVQPLRVPAAMAAAAKDVLDSRSRDAEDASCREVGWVKYLRSVCKAPAHLAIGPAFDGLSGFTSTVLWGDRAEDEKLQCTPLAFWGTSVAIPVARRCLGQSPGTEAAELATQAAEVAKFIDAHTGPTSVGVMMTSDVHASLVFTVAGMSTRSLRFTPVARWDGVGRFVSFIGSCPMTKAERRVVMCANLDAYACSMAWSYVAFCASSGMVGSSETAELVESVGLVCAAGLWASLSPSDNLKGIFDMHMSAPAARAVVFEADPSTWIRMLHVCIVETRAIALQAALSADDTAPGQWVVHALSVIDLCTLFRTISPPDIGVFFEQARRRVCAIELEVRAVLLSAIRMGGAPNSSSSDTFTRPRRIILGGVHALETVWGVSPRSALALVAASRDVEGVRKWVEAERNRMFSTAQRSSVDAIIHFMAEITDPFWSIALIDRRATGTDVQEASHTIIALSNYHTMVWRYVLLSIEELTKTPEYAKARSAVFATLRLTQLLDAA